MPKGKGFTPHLAKKTMDSKDKVGKPPDVCGIIKNYKPSGGYFDEELFRKFETKVMEGVDEIMTRLSVPLNPDDPNAVAQAGSDAEAALCWFGSMQAIASGYYRLAKRASLIGKFGQHMTDLDRTVRMDAGANDARMLAELMDRLADSAAKRITFCQSLLRAAEREWKGIH